ncbi:MAG: malectin domain-containing carbohydrate-binding protein, partial [Planctomycetota bacterium]|nr:malectin domain-containing carbohydrate-binding protein [Planctomycetota bacterium]
IIVRDPRSPRQLNPRVPKDLETVVLKCLRKDAADRYGTAEALAQDLRRFVRGDPVEARPQSKLERLVRRVRPHTGRIVAAASGLLVLVAVAAGFYLNASNERRERVERTETAVTQHLTEAGDLRLQAAEDADGLTKLRDALAAAETAAALATDEVDSGLRVQATTLLETLRREVNNRDMLVHLEELPAPTEVFEKRVAKHHAGFAEAFREYGIDVEKLDPAVAAEKIRESGIATELALALEIWAKLLTRPADVEDSNRLMKVVMLADPDPWRNRLREAVRKGDVDAAEKLAEEVDVGTLSDRRIAFLAAHFYNRGDRDAAESFVRRAASHLVHERSYWTNYWLGLILKEKNQLEESERYLRAAILCRDGDASGRVRAHLGHVLTLRERLDDAAAAYTRAFGLSPGKEASYGNISNLVRALHGKDKGDVLARLIRDLNEVVSSGEGHPEATRALLEAWILEPEALEAAGVLAAARSEVKRARQEDEEHSVQRALVLLAEAQFTAGERRDAVRTLEVADRLFGYQGQSVSILLEKYRATLWPDVVSYASVDAALESGEVLVAEGADVVSYFSIDAALESGEVLVAEGASWRFFRGTREPSPGLEWTRGDFDDSAWEKGPSGIGYGDDDDTTVLEDMKGSYTTVYVRHRFTLPDPQRSTLFWLRVMVDDGCVAYVNGHEIGRVRAGPKGEALRATAVADANAGEPLSPVNWTIPLDWLTKGENVLALQGLNLGIASSDFTLIPAVYAKRKTDEQGDRDRFDKFRGIAQRDAGDGAARLAYLDGKLYARAGDHQKAAAKFREVLDLDRGRPEPYMNLAESLLAVNEPAAGEKVLRELLRQVEFPTPRDWNRWLAFNFVHLGRNPAEMLEVLPDSGVTDYADDLRWLLERLAAREAIRINCSGVEYRSVTGEMFGSDRFHILGATIGDKTYSDKIKKTDDDTLYASWRVFMHASGVPLGYAVPLPPGHYRVKLHFAWVYPPSRKLFNGQEIRPPGLVFDVLLEGRRVLEKFTAKGYTTAEVKTFTERVEDGILNVEFADTNATGYVPCIAAFEIEKVE